MINNGTLWEDTSHDLAGAATGGRATTKYRLTADYLYFESGIVRNEVHEIATAQITDASLKQSMTQRARGLADIMVYVNRGRGREAKSIEAVRNGRHAVEIINQTATLARARVDTRAHAPVAVPAPAVAPDVIAQLRQLGELRDLGVVTGAEFEAKKAEMLARL